MDNLFKTALLGVAFLMGMATFGKVTQLRRL